MSTFIIDTTWYEKPDNIEEKIGCGGIVVRKQGDKVFIVLVKERERPHYVLPKGKLEANESTEAAARREIIEEAGISDLTLIAFLGIRERLNFTKQNWQIVHYFLFITNKQQGVPLDKDRHDASWWFEIDNLPEFFWPEQKELVLENRALILDSIKNYPLS